ncbi:hypothetical protein BaRGS_00007421, partial [Batillaria attramentaria]
SSSTKTPFTINSCCKLQHWSSHYHTRLPGLTGVGKLLPHELTRNPISIKKKILHLQQLHTNKTDSGAAIYANARYPTPVSTADLGKSNLGVSDTH